jgi:very-short-patch-repair endonuclease
VARLAGAQFNRVSRAQLEGLGWSAAAIAHAHAAGRLVSVEQGVYALPPVLADEWGLWMGATLTAPETVLSRGSAAAAWGVLRHGRVVTVTRPGSGGPRRLGGVMVHRSSTLPGECTSLRGIPITTMPRTLLDIAVQSSSSALARAVREALRMRFSTLEEIAGCATRYPRRRGSRRLLTALARYSGLPIERARSGAEVRALEVLRAGGYAVPRLNALVAGEEADLTWPDARVLIEVDGGPFHLDVGLDARKQTCWEEAGWTVRRISSDDVYERPERLLDLAAATNVPRSSP